jgi:DNA (cytosine-5)-methyltransferase 3A
MIKILMAGSPCTFWSNARKSGRETEPSGLGWDLFQNYVIAKEKFKPNFFFYENNHSINPSIKNAISNALGVSNYMIDAALVSAQHREREYWFNWNVEQPEDTHINPRSILDNTNGYIINPCADGKARTLKAGYYKSSNANFITNGGHGATGVAVPTDPSKCLSLYDENGKKRKNKGNIAYNVSNGYIDVDGENYPIDLPNGHYIIRKFTPEECERLQALPAGYTNVGISPTHRYMGIGNGWCVNVVEHILFEALKDIPKDEEIIVVSLYDGIGTGRYVLDKLGFTNIKYFAYEIEPTAIKVSTTNYPDIIQMGDAFDVRKDDWLNILQKYDK